MLKEATFTPLRFDAANPFGDFKQLVARKFENRLLGPTIYFNSLQAISGPPPSAVVGEIGAAKASKINKVEKSQFFKL